MHGGSAHASSTYTLGCSRSRTVSDAIISSFLSATTRWPSSSCTTPPKMSRLPNAYRPKPSATPKLSCMGLTPGCTGDTHDEVPSTHWWKGTASTPLPAYRVTCVVVSPWPDRVPFLLGLCLWHAPCKLQVAVAVEVRPPDGALRNRKEPVEGPAS